MSPTARSARCDGRRGAPGRLLADDRGDRQMTTTASTATESARSETMSVLPHTIASPPMVGPVIGQERIEAIDILRGVAILGNAGRRGIVHDVSAHLPFIRRGVGVDDWRSWKRGVCCMKLF